MDGRLPLDTRFFSLEEANRMLPLVRRIVDDILATWGALEPVMSEWQGLARSARGTPSAAALKEELDRRTEALDALVVELHDLGCQFKGFDGGLVDWYSLYAGRPVFLCWKRGEPEIGWWHQVDAGFAGRQPILDSQRAAFRASMG